MNITIRSTSERELYVSAGAKTIREALAEAVAARANLRYANLGFADLRSANLRSANLGSADLRSADLRYANLGSADLRYADLRFADLRFADLRSADLRYADLGFANLRSAKNAGLAVARTLICPGGDIIGWKKCCDDKIVKLLIPADAARFNASGRKCRAERATVTAIYASDGAEVDTAVSAYDYHFVYRVGETVSPTMAFDTERWNECASGIHFFITREEAEAWS